MGLSLKHLTLVAAALLTGAVSIAQTTQKQIVAEADCVLKVADMAHPQTEPTVHFKALRYNTDKPGIVSGGEAKIAQRELSADASWAGNNSDFWISVFYGTMPKNPPPPVCKNGQCTFVPSNMQLLGGSIGGFNSDGVAQLLLPKASNGQDVFVSCQRIK